MHFGMMLAPKKSNIDIPKMMVWKYLENVPLFKYGYFR